MWIGIQKSMVKLKLYLLHELAESILKQAVWDSFHKILTVFLCLAITFFPQFELYSTYALAVRGFERFTLIRDLQESVRYSNALNKLPLESLRSIQLMFNSNDKVVTVAIPDKDYVDFADMIKRNKPDVPDLEGDGYDECGIVFDTGYCPTCRHMFELDYSDKCNFCPDCGQRLDWSSIDKD